MNAYLVHFVHKPPCAAFSVKVLADDVLHAREMGERMLTRQLTRRARPWWQLDRVQLVEEHCTGVVGHPIL